MMKSISEMTLNKANILGISINSSPKEELLKKIVEIASGEYRNNVGAGLVPARNQRATTRVAPTVVFTPNPEFVVEARYDHEFRDLLNKADINLPDGIGLVWAGRLLKLEIKERVSGADMVEKLLEIGNRESWEIGIIGARRGIWEEEEELLRRLREKYQNIQFINLDISSRERDPSTLVGMTKEKLSFRASGASREISFFRGDINFNIVFACQGMKKQEQWIWENKDRINAAVFMGIGGSLDFISGFTKRAPLFIRKIGLEWFWRVLQRPSHLKRIWKAVFIFGWMVLQEKFVSSD